MRLSFLKLFTIFRVFSESVFIAVFHKIFMMLRRIKAIDIFMANSAPISFRLAENRDPISRETIGVAAISAAEFFHPGEITQAMSVDANVFFSFDIFEIIKGKTDSVKNFHDDVRRDKKGDHDNCHKKWS